METPQRKLAAWLGNVTDAASWRYGLKDDQKVGLDCLKLVQLGKDDFLGVSHALRDKRFVLRLTHSRDLLRWTHVADLDTHASQGHLAAQPDGSFWLAYEHDEPNACFVRLRRYPNRAALEQGRFSTETTLGRTLAPTAEGTPTIERVERDAIRLRFHYYRDGDVDRAATGILRGASDWTTAPDKAIDTVLEAKGVRGNIGGRCRIVLGGRAWWLHEGQLRKNDWASWRCWLLDDPVRSVEEIPIQTHGGSTSFANPFATVVNLPAPTVVATAFLPSEGAADSEAGCLLWTRPLDSKAPF